MEAMVMNYNAKAMTIKRAIVMFKVSAFLVEDLLIPNVEVYETTGEWREKADYFIIDGNFMLHLEHKCIFNSLRTVKSFDTIFIGVSGNEINILQHKYADFTSRGGLRNRDTAPINSTSLRSSG